MTLIAHWPIDDGFGAGPTVTRDVAGGISGAHDGVPQSLSTASYAYGNYRGGGVNGHHLHKRRNYRDGSVRSIAFPADFRLLGALTVSAWVAHDDDYYHWGYSDRAIVSCTGLDETEPENDLFEFRCKTDRSLELRWENGAGVDVIVNSGGAPLAVAGWNCVAAERYEVTPGFWGVRFYVNGSLFVDQNNGGSGWLPPSGGGNSLPNIACTETWHGGDDFRFDSVRVYDAAVGGSQIAADYAADVAAGASPTQVLKTDWPSPLRADVLVGVPGDNYSLIPSGPLSPREGAGFTR